MTRRYPCSLSCATLVRFSTFLQWCVATKASSSIVTHDFHDFLLTRDCEALLQPFVMLTEQLGIGGRIELDTVHMVSRLPRGAAISGNHC